MTNGAYSHRQLVQLDSEKNYQYGNSNTLTPRNLDLHLEESSLRPSYHRDKLRVEKKIGKREVREQKKEERKKGREDEKRSWSNSFFHLSPPDMKVTQGKMGG